MDLTYHLVDVFTDRPFGGNPLAVFPSAEPIPGELMQQLAGELNLSETTFVLPPDDPAHDFRVRIFTPRAELPIAGHPTVGTAFALTELGTIPGERGLIDAAGVVHVTFEEGVGPIPVQIHREAVGTGVVWMEQPLPEHRPAEISPEVAAAALSLEPGDLHPELPLEIGSAGVPFLFVPLRGLDAVARASLRLDLWRRHLAATDGRQVFLLTLETESPDATVHARMFAPGLGVPEDPATGAATGPLASYLHRHGVAPEDGQVDDEGLRAVRMRSEQGLEMGRPSVLDMEVTHDRAGDVVRVRIGGRSVAMGSGSFRAGVSPG